MEARSQDSAVTFLKEREAYQNAQAHDLVNHRKLWLILLLGYAWREWESLRLAQGWLQHR